jgi:two-component system, response regulator / RNA-binding antiterminator
VPAGKRRGETRRAWTCELSEVTNWHAHCSVAAAAQACLRMSLRILLIDTEPHRAWALEEQLSASGFAEIVRLPAGTDLAGAVEKTRPDLIIIDMGLPDRDTLEDIRLVSAAHPIVMFAGSDDPAFAEEAIAAGVCSYNLSGVALPDVKPIMASAIALFRRYRRVEDELAGAKAMLEERRLIERAKAILMKGRKMTEPEAYRWLQKKAMNENRKLAQVVEEFVARHGADCAAAGAQRKRP